MLLWVIKTFQRIVPVLTKVLIVVLQLVRLVEVELLKKAFLVEDLKVLRLVEVVVSSVDNIKLSTQEAQAYYDAANELYDMYIEAADHVIDNDLFFELGIPFNLVDVIKKSWESDVHWHIYGAFLFSGGLNNSPIKLLEFQADTPSKLLQTSQEQLGEHSFNEIYEKVSENFKRLITLDDGLEHFDERYDNWKILFSSPSDDEEKEKTSRFLQHLADEAGFQTSFSYLHEVAFNEEGIHDQEGNNYEYWYKNYSWLDIATDEGELATTLTSIMDKQQAIIINPAYTLLFESRGMLKILKDLYPDSPYLLKTSFKSFKDSQMRTMFGEGEEYSNFTKIYQEEREDTYNAKVFFAYEACGLSFLSEEESFIKAEYE
ncbi:MAG TPA: glutathionylspermidine synthase [Sulfurimonas sp.]|nr:glutathionylspermidine synthase [Sulfurimonas sp.]HIM75522.1 glutathionylspermidine synthase [Campylobacterales bacterium]